MHVKDFVRILDAGFYTGIPDSQLKALCDYLIKKYGTDNRQHIIGVNEGNCTALAAGYHLATGKIPLVYLQNSGLGNIINPAASLLNEKIYAIPCIFVVGWRGEPGIYDEPQHIFQGEITLGLLDAMDMPTFVVTADTTCEELENQMSHFIPLLAKGQQIVFVVKKGALSYDADIEYNNGQPLLREVIIRQIVFAAKNDYIVATTGKTSRELFEIREERGEDHAHDFLTVGSMGHASAIAFSMSLYHPQKRIWCIDGDGALLMHMGTMALIGTYRPRNMVHILINNGAHESVGGQPTVSGEIDLSKIAAGFGYEIVERVSTISALRVILEKTKNSSQLIFIEVKAAIGARSNLGRPTNTPLENKKRFMESLMGNIGPVKIIP